MIILETRGKGAQNQTHHTGYMHATRTHIQDHKSRITRLRMCTSSEIFRAMDQDESLITRFEKLAHLWDDCHFSEVSPSSKAYTEAKGLVEQHDKVMARIVAIRKRIERTQALIEHTITDDNQTKRMYVRVIFST